MADIIEYQSDGGIAVLTLPVGSDGRPGSLDLTTRRGLAVALEQAARDEAVTGIVIAGAGRGFSEPVPLGEIAGGEAEPKLETLCRQIETCAKPVVAALRGELRDGGVELALAARARLAVSGTRLCLGDLRLGLIPGAGATQRLPRLIGAGTALDLMLSGRSISADSAALRGLFRKVVARNVVGEAVQAARAMVGEAPPGTPPGFADPMAYQAELRERRAAAGGLPPEAAALFESVEAAQLLPIEAGLAMEGALRDDLLASGRAKGLIHTVNLEHRQRQYADVKVPKNVAVLGDGPLAFGLVQRLLAAGLSVKVGERVEGGAAQLIRRLDAAYQAEVARGRLDPAVAQANMDRLEGGASGAQLAQAELVIEACEAGAAAVPALIELVERAVGPEVPVVMTSGMTLTAGDFAALLGGRILGLALHAVPQRPGLAELVAPDKGAAAVMQTASLMHRMERQVVHCLAQNGLIVGHLKAAMLGAAIWCVARGATPHVVDEALGWQRGPFRQADAEGLGRQRVRLNALGLGEISDGFFAAFLEQGREGRATGRAIFQYGQQGTTGEYDATAAQIVDNWRGRGASDALHPEIIRRRIWSAMFSTGLQLVERGCVEDAGALDLAALAALGLPRASGGPMKAAELRGLLLVKGELERWEGDSRALWQRSSLLAEMIKNGRGFGI